MMQTVDMQELTTAVSNNVDILNQHHLLFDLVTPAVDSLTQQQGVQQQQLA